MISYDCEHGHFCSHQNAFRLECSRYATVDISNNSGISLKHQTIPYEDLRAASSFPSHILIILIFADVYFIMPDFTHILQAWSVSTLVSPENCTWCRDFLEGTSIMSRYSSVLMDRMVTLHKYFNVEASMFCTLWSILSISSELSRLILISVFLKFPLIYRITRLVQVFVDPMFFFRFQFSGTPFVIVL